MKKIKLLVLFLLPSFINNATSTDFLTFISQDPLVPRETLIKSWAQLGKVDECVKLLKAASIEDLQTFSFTFLKNIPIKNSIDVDSILPIISLLPDPDDQVSLYWLLLSKLNLDPLPIKKKEILIEEYKNALNKIDKQEDEYLHALIDFNFAIEKHREYNAEYKKSLLEIETRIHSISDINRKSEMLEYLVYSDIESEISENYIRHISELKAIAPTNRMIASTDSLLEAAIGIEDFEFLKIILSQFADTSNAISALNSRASLFLDLFLKSFNEKYFKDFENMSDKKQYVSLLTRNLNLEKAKQFAITDKNWVLANDWYLNCLGRLLIERSTSRIGLLSAINIAKRIMNESLKAEIRIEAAQKLINQFDDQFGYSILDQVSEDLVNKSIQIYNGMKTISDVWIEARNFDEALKYIEKINDPFEKDYQYLIIAEQYLFHGNLERGQSLLFQIKSSSAKGYLTAAIGALKICQGSSQLGEELFAQAFTLIKKESNQSTSLFSFENALPVLLDYYVNAKKGLFSPILKKANCY